MCYNKQKLTQQKFGQPQNWQNNTQKDEAILQELYQKQTQIKNPQILNIQKDTKYQQRSSPQIEKNYISLESMIQKNQQFNDKMQTNFQNSSQQKQYKLNDVLKDHFEQRKDQVTRTNILNQNIRAQIGYFAYQSKQVLYSFSAIRLGVFEAKLQRKPNFYEEWEKGEFGSTINVIKAYEFILQQDSYMSPLTLDYISEIRRHFRDQEGNYQKDGQENNVDKISKFQIQFGLPYLNAKQKYYLKQHQQQLKKKLQIFLQKNIQHNPYEILDNMTTISSSQRASVKEKTEWINALLYQYEDYINQQGDIGDLQFLQALSDLIMNLERIHPYMDFNCRTFGVILLNKELLRRGMSPSIVEDPNDFDYLDVEGAVEIIQEGQRNFQRLYQNGKIHITEGYSKVLASTEIGIEYLQILQAADPNDQEIIQNLKYLRYINIFFCKQQTKTEYEKNHNKYIKNFYKKLTIKQKVFQQQFNISRLFKILLFSNLFVVLYFYCQNYKI